MQAAEDTAAASKSDEALAAAQRQIDEMTAGLRRIRNLCNASPDNHLSAEVQRVVRSVLRSI
jgi:hypothetical protein